MLLQGLLDVAAGGLTLLKPAITAAAFLLRIAVWAIGMGMLQLIAAARLRDEVSGEWWLALSGVGAIAFGVLLMREQVPA